MSGSIPYAATYNLTSWACMRRKVFKDRLALGLL